MNTDDFEKRLQQQPMRPVPADWRDGILKNVKSSLVSHHESRITNHVPWWKELLWPCPQAWAALAAIWLVLLTVDFSSTDSVREMAKETKSGSGEVLMTWREQNELLSQLIEPLAKEVAERPKVFVPRPRSEGRFEFVAV